MKRLFGILALITCVLSSCTKSLGSWEEGHMNNPGDYSFPGETRDVFIVSVRQDDVSRIYFMVGDSCRVYPENYTEPYTGPCRIIGQVSYWHNDVCSLLWMDFLEKGSVQKSYSQEGDGVDVLSDWMTSVEDGFLTLHYSTFWGDGGVAHTFTLVTGENPENPYEVRLVHENNGDPPLTEGDALIYFDLTSLPPTGDAGQTLTLKYKNTAGNEVTKSFFFKSRQ